MRGNKDREMQQNEGNSLEGWTLASVLVFGKGGRPWTWILILK